MFILSIIVFIVFLIPTVMMLYGIILLIKVGFDGDTLIFTIFMSFLSILYFCMFLDAKGNIQTKVTYQKPIIEKIEQRNSKANIYIKDRDVIIKDNIKCLNKKNIWIKTIHKQDPKNNYSKIVCGKRKQ